MDTSGTYAKMSREAWGDDESYVPQVGDYAIRYIETGNRVGLVSMNRDQGIEHLYWHTLDEEDGLTLREPQTILTRLIPLYRQDQLQELAMAHRWRHEEQRPINAVVGELDHFQYWGLNDCDGMDWCFAVGTAEPSMEQLWLAFVKKELHSKTWNGAEWTGE